MEYDSVEAGWSSQIVDAVGFETVSRESLGAETLGTGTGGSEKVGAPHQPAGLAAFMTGLQQSVGNRVVSRLIEQRTAQRIAHGTAKGTARGNAQGTAQGTAKGNVQRQQAGQPVAPAANAKAPGSPLDLTQLKATGTFSTSGSVSSAPSSKIAGGIDIIGPQIDSQHTVTSTGTLAESIEVGYIQTLRSSNRVGIYTKGGNETSRDRSSVPKSRDARPYVDQQGAKSVSRPPWYDSEKGGVTGLSSGGDAKIHTIDKPSFVLNAKADDGAELTATEGTENFVLSVAAKPFGSGTATPIPGGSIKWGFSWSQSIDAKGAGSGGGAATQSPDQGEDVSSEGEIAKNSMHSWLDFKTKEQAKMHSASTLVDNLGKASAAGPDAAIALASTVEALRDINPRFTATVDAITRSSLVGADQLAVTIGAKGSFTSSQPVNKNAPAKIGFNLMTVCSSPLELLSGLTVSVSVTSDWRDGTVGVARFPSVSEMATGKVVEAGSSPKGSYNVSISL